jgi:hypothetical protein
MHVYTCSHAPKGKHYVVCVYIYIYIYIYMYIYTCVRACVYLHGHSCMHTYVYKSMPVFLGPDCIHTFIHAYIIHTYTHTFTAYIPVFPGSKLHTYIYTCIHTFVREYAHHTYAHIRSQHTYLFSQDQIAECRERLALHILIIDLHCVFICLYL